MHVDYTITANLAALQFHSQCTLVFTKDCGHLTQSCLLKFQVIRLSELLNQTIMCKMLPDSFVGCLVCKIAETTMVLCLCAFPGRRSFRPCCFRWTRARCGHHSCNTVFSATPQPGHMESVCFMHVLSMSLSVFST